MKISKRFLSIRAFKEGLISGIGCSSIIIFRLGLFSLTGYMTSTFSISDTIYSIGSLAIDSCSEASGGFEMFESS